MACLGGTAARRGAASRRGDGPRLGLRSTDRARSIRCARISSAVENIEFCPFARVFGVHSERDKRTAAKRGGTKRRCRQFLLPTQASRGHGRAAWVSGLCHMRRASPGHGQQQSGGEDDAGRVASASAVVVAPRLAVCSVLCAVPYRVGV